MLIVGHRTFPSFRKQMADLTGCMLAIAVVCSNQHAGSLRQLTYLPHTQCRNHPAELYLRQHGHVMTVVMRTHILDLTESELFSLVEKHNAWHDVCSGMQDTLD